MNWQLITLSTMTVALIVVTIVQIVIAMAAMKVAREAAETAREIRREIAPLMQKANRIADDAARATALVVVQVERIDDLIATTTERIEETVVAVQKSVLGPIRTGAAFVGALRAVLGAFGNRPRRRSAIQQDDEDALFVG